MKLEIAMGEGPEKTVFDYDPNAVMIGQAEKIEAHIGGPFGEWEDGLLRGRTVCYQCLAWLVIFQGDPALKIRDVTDFPLSGLMTAYMAVRLQELIELKDELEAAVADEAAKAS